MKSLERAIKLIIVNLIGEKDETEFFIGFIDQFMGIKLKVDKSIIRAFEYEDGDILML